MKPLVVAGARPNFIKAGPLLAALNDTPDAEPVFVDTGQHYDPELSTTILNDLDVAKPDYSLGVGSGSHAQQTARIMLAIEEVFVTEQPDVVVVFGDVNSTIAAGLTAAKLHIPVAHVEAGLRSLDWSMPEEINRVLTDRLSDTLFVTEQSGIDHLVAEGVPADRIFFVGNLMIDALLAMKRRNGDQSVAAQLGLDDDEFAVLTMHRPGNLDDERRLDLLPEMLAPVAERMPIVFSIHPRTRAVFEATGMFDRLGDRIRIVDPLGYADFVGLMSEARLVLTDSGGIQEESMVLRVPCLTMRDNTERPATLIGGMNRLVGMSPDRLSEAFSEAMNLDTAVVDMPTMWDGKSAKRIADVLIDRY